MAERFNGAYGETFRVPEPVIPMVGARIMGLDDPTKKMSKSDPRPGHAVRVLDSPSEITKKVKSATTDSGTEIKFDESRPGVTNLLTIYQAITGETAEAIEAHFAGKMYGHLKVELAERVVEALRTVREGHARFMSDPAELERILTRSADRIRTIADATMKTVHQRLGLG